MIILRLKFIHGNLKDCQKKTIKNIATSDSNFAPTLIGYYPLPDIKFNGHCLINNSTVSIKITNLYISYTLDRWSRNLNTDFTLNNCLFRYIKLTKNANSDKYKYSDYGMECDSRSELLFTGGSFGKNVTVFGADMSSSVHIDNKKKDTLILGEGPRQGFDDITLTAEAKYPIDFTQSGKRFVFGLHYNGSDSFLFVNATKIHQFNVKD